MGSTEYFKSDPPALLVNEIEILLAQARLMELYLKQAEAEAADEMARLHERYENELKTLRAETEAWRVRFDQVEALRQTEQATKEADDQARRRLDSGVATLRDELQQKTLALAQRQAALENLALAHKNQLQKFESKIDEQRCGIDERDLELEKVRARTQSLDQRIEELHAELRQAERTALTQAQKMTEESAMKIDDRNERLAHNAAELQQRGAAQSDLEQSLQNEIDRLIREAQEKNQILQDRNDELVRVKAEMDRLHERFNQLESPASQTENALASDAEHMRAEFQAQLSLLQAELSQKEWALEEQRAAARGVGQAHAQQIEAVHEQYRQQMETLRQQLANSESPLDEYNDRFVLGDGQLTEEQQERKQKYREVVTAVTNGTDPSFSASENRRWHSRFNRKRRWKS